MTGNASSATKLSSQHKINSVVFDGTKDITISAPTKKYNVSTTATWSGSAAPYTQTVTISGITANDIVNVYPVWSSTLATRKTQKDDYNKYDLIIVMEERNRRDLLRIIGEDKDNKIHLLMEYSDCLRMIEDPWYTGDFDTAYDLIYEGCVGLYNYLESMEVQNEI